MRKVRHKNVVQFIGACTRKPNLCIVFEFMAGGSVYDYIRRVSVPGRLPGVLAVRAQGRRVGLASGNAQAQEQAPAYCGVRGGAG